MAYAAGIQKVIYDSPPCYKYPTECPASEGGELPNRVHIALQVPAYVCIGLAEIFASVTGLEYAFTKAPASMKSVVTSVYLLQNAFGSAIGIGVATRAKNPDMVVFYSCLAGITFLAGTLFWFCFRKLNDTEEEMNALDKTAEVKLVNAEELSTPLKKLYIPHHHHHHHHQGEQGQQQQQQQQHHDAPSEV